MPAKSQSQQRLMGMVHAYQQGRLKNPSPQVKSVAKHIQPQDAKDFAETKHEGLPKKASLLDPDPPPASGEAAVGGSWEAWLSQATQEFVQKVAAGPPQIAAAPSPSWSSRFSALLSSAPARAG